MFSYFHAIPSTIIIAQGIPESPRPARNLGGICDLHHTPRQSDKKHEKKIILRSTLVFNDCRRRQIVVHIHILACPVRLASSLPDASSVLSACVLKIVDNEREDVR
jgi:hypothetical protein